jgi:hypothetical protein
MKKLVGAGLFAALTLPVLALAQSALDGTWKIDLAKTQLSKKPDVYLLQHGMYECKTCVPVIHVKADGEAQAVTGHPYFDQLAVKVLDDHSINMTRSKNGKAVMTEKMTVSADGTTARIEFSDSSATNGAPVTGATEQTRVAKGPAGAHAISGSWRTDKLADFSDNGLSITYKTQDDVLTMTTPTGQSYAAKLDGSFAPYRGDPGTTSVAIHRINKHTFQETDKRDGKVIAVARMTVAANGTSLKVVVHDTEHGTTSTFVAAKQ